MAYALIVASALLVAVGLGQGGQSHPGQPVWHVWWTLAVSIFVAVVGAGTVGRVVARAQRALLLAELKAELATRQEVDVLGDRLDSDIDALRKTIAHQVEEIARMRRWALRHGEALVRLEERFEAGMRYLQRDIALLRDLLVRSTYGKRHPDEEQKQ